MGKEKFMNSKLIKITAFIFFIIPMVCQAEIIKIGLTGVVDNVSDPYNLLGNQIHQGDTITGFYVYDSTTPDTNPLSIVGEYWHSGEPYGIVLTAGTITFQTNPLQTNPLNGRFLVDIINDSQGNDSYGVGSRNNLKLANGTIVDSLSWGLTDNFGVAISSTDLPVTPPDLSKWPFNSLYIRGGADDGTAPCYDKPFFVDGHVTSDYLIPEPVSLCLLAFGALFLRRKA
jgi:hypothetical protein